MPVSMQFNQGLTPTQAADELLAAAEAILSYLHGPDHSLHHTREVLVKALRAADYGELGPWTERLKAGELT